MGEEVIWWVSVQTGGWVCEGFRVGVGGRERECVCVLFIGTQFSNLYTAVDTPASV